MEKAKTYKELLDAVKDYIDGNKLADDECLLMIASTKDKKHGAIVGNGRELLTAAAAYMAEDEQMLKVMDAAVSLAKTVKAKKQRLPRLRNAL